MRCGICFEVMHQVVTLMPCLHNYCGGCFSDWLKRSKECPHCRDIVVEVKKNATLNNVVLNYLELNPDEKRDPEELREVEEKNIFNADVYKVAAPQPEEEKK